VSARHHGGAGAKRRGDNAPGPTQRQLRVGEELRHALVEVLRESHARDPSLQNLNVTVTEVRVSPDLRNATAFVMPLGGEHGAEIVAALNHAAAYFRSQLAHRVNLRYAPSVGFALDTSFVYAERIEDLLRAPTVQRDLDTDSDA
jgi:ribosome-binding factor A